MRVRASQRLLIAGSGPERLPRPQRLCSPAALRWNSRLELQSEPRPSPLNPHAVPPLWPFVCYCSTLHTADLSGPCSEVFFFFLFFPCPQHACLISIDKCRLGRTLAGPPVKIHIINKSISTCAPGCRCLTLTCKLDFLPIWYAYFTHRFMAVTRLRPDLAFREADGITKGMIF